MTYARVIPQVGVWIGNTGLAEGERYLIVNPFFHAFGYKAGIVAALTVGATLVPQAVFDIPTAIEMVVAHGITMLPGPPAIYQTFLNHPHLDLAKTARSLEIGTILVPPAPGVFSALGLLEAEVEHHLVRTVLRPLFGTKPSEIAAVGAEMEREAEALWPTLPTQVEGMQAWLTKADALTRNLPLHRATLQTLRTQALAPDGASDTAKPRFTDTETQWQHDTLAGLVSGLEAFVDSDPQRGLIANVRRRLDVASQIERRTLLEPRAAWESAGAAIAGDPRYHGLRLRPQLGLVPLGPDPGSGLWEFAHLATGEPAVRGADGKLMLGTWQGLYLYEHRHAGHARRVVVTVTGEH